MKNIKFILFAVIVGIFVMANTASASDEDDFYTLVDKCCDYFGYDSSVNQGVYNLWSRLEDLSYMYCFECREYSDVPFPTDGVICLRFSDSPVYPSCSYMQDVSYGYFMTFDSYTPVTYCNLYFTANSVYYDYGICNNLSQKTSSLYGTYYIGTYNRNYTNIYNNYNLVGLDLGAVFGVTVFIKNYNSFFISTSMGNSVEQFQSYHLFDYH